MKAIFGRNEGAMNKQFKKEDDGSITLSINFRPEGQNMLEQEQKILEAVNGLGAEATAHTLQAHDTDARIMEVNGQRHTVKKNPSRKHTKRPSGRSK